MKVFTNRLYDRGFINLLYRGYKKPDIYVLRRHNDVITVVQQVVIDPTSNITSQIEAYFRNIMRNILQSHSRIIFFEGGGDIKIPDFFRDFCREYDIEIGIITPDEMNYWLNRIE
jgi:hypothetical protein